MIKQSDHQLLKQKHISTENVNAQIKQFQKGFDFLKITAPAVVKNGISVLSENELKEAENLYNNADVKPIKFVPASGAASRMFKDLFAILDSNGADKKEIASTFFNKIKNFAFVESLEKLFSKKYNKPFIHAVDDKDLMLLNALLTSEGLDYGNLPKGLLQFHAYESESKTPAQEHLEEGIAYSQKNGEVHIHFTVSPSHMKKFKDHIDKNIGDYPSIKMHIAFSIQKESTDTIAVDMENFPFRLDDGTMLFRPAGHGALLENLNELDAAIIFIKNIDNVSKKRLLEKSSRYKKVLAGVLLKYQTRTFQLIKEAMSGKDILAEGKSLLKEMGVKGNFNQNDILNLLDRPIRVCGMVKNEGEPGGGPFWVKVKDMESLQIVESSQIDLTNNHQATLFKSSTHFNPVDIVCGVKNHKGEKFDLLKYRDENTGFITEKSFKGKKLKAMELPGLWNGGMAFWNTIFVEVPSFTFNPVKTIMDLLKENHQ